MSYVDKNLKVDDCFQHNQIIFIYELLNSGGINKLFNYKENIVMPINNDIIQEFSKNSLITLNKTSEFLIQISHRYKKIKDTFLFDRK